MMPTRFNLIEQLQIIISKAPKEPSYSKTASFDQGDIPNIFRKMYEIANSLASKEGLIWIQVKHKQDLINKMQEQQSRPKDKGETELLSPLLETQLLDFVNGKREDYMKRMTQLLELYAKSKWATEDKYRAE